MDDMTDSESSALSAAVDECPARVPNQYPLPLAPTYVSACPEGYFPQTVGIGTTCEQLIRDSGMTLAEFGKANGGVRDPDGGYRTSKYLQAGLPSWMTPYFDSMQMYELFWILRLFDL